MNNHSLEQYKLGSAVSASTSAGGLLQRQCACGTHTMGSSACAECSGKKGLLQRKAAGHESVSEVPPIVHEVLRSPGQPLDSTTRAFFEPRFGQDLSQVRMHTGTRASVYAGLGK